MSRVFAKTRLILITMMMVALTAAVPIVSSPVVAQAATTVYSTNTGKCYHLDGCSSLKKSKNETTVQKALDKGLKPCSKCNPPASDGEEVVRSSTTADEEQQEYMLNLNTNKFHRMSCKDIKKMKDKNKKVETNTRQAIIDKGYSPCKNCKP